MKFSNLISRSEVRNPAAPTGQSVSNAYGIESRSKLSRRFVLAEAEERRTREGA